MNSAEVHLTFTDPQSASRFYFHSPGEGFCHTVNKSHKVMKCVEGNISSADRLERKARKARGVTTINVSRYDVKN